MNRIIRRAAVGVVCGAALVAAAGEWSVSSPNGRITAAVSLGGTSWTWSVSFDGRPVTEASPLGIVRDDVTFDGSTPSHAAAWRIATRCRTASGARGGTSRTS